MLDSYSASQPALYENPNQSIDVRYYLDVIKRRFPLFALSFLLTISIAFTFIAAQRPIFRAEGEILLQSAGIAPDLVHPTVTELTDERFEVFKQRIASAENLNAIIHKYDLFSREKGFMSELELLDLMRHRVIIKPVAPDRPSSPTIAFLVAFEYEVPSVALAVANEFLKEILNEDVSRRTNNATEATRVLEQEVKRLGDLHDAVLAKIDAAKKRPPDREQAVSEERKAQTKSLADLQAELIQKSSVYSEEHPALRELRRKIAALKLAIAATPQSAPVLEGGSGTDVSTAVLDQEEFNIRKSLDDASLKLSAARLGENMEKNQQSQRLRVVQYPELPYQPVRPKKLKWIAISLALAGMVGAAFVLAAEMLNRSIRSSNEVAHVIDRHLLSTIPYLSLPGEERRKRITFVMLSSSFTAVLLVAVVGVLFMRIHVNLDLPWIYGMTGLLK